MNINKSWYIKPKGIPEHDSAGGVIVRKEGTQIFFATTHEIDTNSLILPKGHVEKGEDFESAARREIKEETGLAELKLICFLDTKERLDYEKKGWKKTHYYLFFTTQKTGIPTDSKHQKVVWVKLEEYTKHLWPEQQDLISENINKIKSSI